MLARDLPPQLDRPVIGIITTNINEHSVFQNGLYQNIYHLYNLVEALGMNAVLLVNDKPEVQADFMRQLTIMTVEDLIRRPIPLTAVIEAGLSTADHIRKFMKACGGRVLRIYLGNVYNIDIETPIYYNPINFTHHVIGTTDYILTSPHYSHYIEYLAAVDHVDISQAVIAPYVWDPCFLTEWGSNVPSWRPPACDEPPTFVIMEPNISFQKHGVAPLLVLEKWVLANSITKARIVVINGDRLRAAPYYVELEKQLDIFKKGFIESRPRMTVREVMKEFPSATVMCYHMDNELNYMTLEFLYAGYPIIHNAATWRNAGYYYNDLTGAAAACQTVRQHSNIQAAYRSQTQEIFWKHSIHNPAVQEKWREILIGTQ